MNVHGFHLVTLFCRYILLTPVWFLPRLLVDWDIKWVGASNFELRCLLPKFGDIPVINPNWGILRTVSQKIRPSYISDTPVTCKFFNPPYPVRAAEIQQLSFRRVRATSCCRFWRLGERNRRKSLLIRSLENFCLDRPSTHKILQYWLVVSFSLFSIMYGIILPID